MRALHCEVEWPINWCVLAYNANCIFVRVSVREQFFLSFTTDEGTFSSSFNFVDFEMIESFDVSDEVVFFLGFLT